MFFHFSQVDAFHESLEGLEKYVSRVATFLEEYVTQGQKMNEIGFNLCKELSNREYARTMFTNNHENLGSISEHVFDFSDKLLQIQQKQLVMKVLL